MRTNTINRTVAGGLLLLMTGVGMACSKSASAFESPYCDNIRDLVTFHSGEDGVAGQKAFFTKYSAFMDTGLATAPKSIHADWVVYHAGIAPQKAILEKYGYDQEAFDKTATDAEKAAMNIEESDPKVGAAVERIKAYEAFTCGSGQPPDAKVSFKGEKPGPYCDAVKEGDSRTDDLDFFDPAAVRAFFTDPAKKKQSAEDDARLIATAPKVIKDDVKAEVEWWDTKQKPVQAKFGYDMKKLILKGSAQDLRDLQLTDKRVANHFARATAYEHTVCGL